MTNRLTFAEEPELDKLRLADFAELCGKQSALVTDERWMLLAFVGVLWIHSKKEDSSGER